jgi:nucleotide-binding universal stress UspA family protein
LLVALDGTDRGLTVFNEACRLAEALDVTLDLVTVERAMTDEPAALAREVRNSRTESLARAVCKCAHPLKVRRGHVVTEILQEIEVNGAHVLVVGYHRGGPPGFVEAGSVARQLSHSAPCAVLTIPL